MSDVTCGGLELAAQSLRQISLAGRHQGSRHADGFAELAQFRCHFLREHTADPFLCASGCRCGRGLSKSVILTFLQVKAEYPCCRHSGQLLT